MNASAQQAVCTSGKKTTQYIEMKMKRDFIAL